MNFEKVWALLTKNPSIRGRQEEILGDIWLKVQEFSQENPEATEEDAARYLACGVYTDEINEYRRQGFHVENPEDFIGSLINPEVGPEGSAQFTELLTQLQAKLDEEEMALLLELLDPSTADPQQRRRRLKGGTSRQGGVSFKRAFAALGWKPRHGYYVANKLRQEVLACVA